MTAALPIDPDAINPEDRGERRAVLEMDHEAAVDHVRETLVDVGFGVATEFSPAELLNEKIDADRAPYTIIGACNPTVADDALTETGGEMGGLFPCNVVIWEREDGTQEVFHVSIMKIARLVGLAPDTEAWQEIVDRTGEYLDEAWAALDQN